MMHKPLLPVYSTRAMHQPLPPAHKVCIAPAPYGISLVAWHITRGLGKPTVLGFSFSSCIHASNAGASLWQLFPVMAVKFLAGVKKKFGDL